MNSMNLIELGRLTIKRVFDSGRVLVTTVQRVHIKMVVAAFAFNLYQLCTLKNAKVI